MGQTGAMVGVFSYIGQLLEFALRGSVRQADKWQIIGATALPSLLLGVAFQLAGLAVPVIEAAEFPTYLGYGLIAWIAIRFFLIGPYALYNEQLAETAQLRLELSKPERMILEHLAKKKAKNRIKLLTLLKELYNSGFDYKKAGTFQGYRYFNEASHLIPVTGLDPRLLNPVVVLLKAVEFRFENELIGNWITDLECLRGIMDYIDGRVTIEDLLLRWPKDTELKKPQ
ncbi:hypothetical protein I5L01_14815 [Erythrobacter sp. YJ-T3-07]|uniref:hypothetical protein n=1 Tax=Erythrobacter sp. YJ-T3-07 TaxID=2793063 RepID=UPI0018D46A7B|nr:hypothetical protein [Erythrobacter sp. YJ-T3-07]MBH1945496.1 hypothetical protein [Erythrobacter sp. YJ-T3-07]